MTVEFKYAKIGVISEGTLRNEDLLHAFADELEWQMHRNGDWFASPEHFDDRDRLTNLMWEAREVEDFEEADELINEILSALNEFAPPYCYFGMGSGDGACFGFFPRIDDMLAEVEHGDDWPDDPVEGQEFAWISDHGNVTYAVYRNGKWREIWAVV